MTEGEGVATIAKGLTKAQRGAVLKSDGWQPAFMLREDHDGRKAAGDIRASRLFEKRMGGAQCTHYRLTPLGLAVRAYLQDHPHD